MKTRNKKYEALENTSTGTIHCFVNERDTLCGVIWSVHGLIFNIAEADFVKVNKRITCKTCLRLANKKVSSLKDNLRDLENLR